MREDRDRRSSKKGWWGGEAARLLIVLGAILACGVSAALAVSVPEKFNYQGVLRDSAGNALNGDYAMVFRLFGPSGPALVQYCRDDCGSPDPACLVSCGTSVRVLVTDGLFSVSIGDLGYGDVVDGPAPGTVTSIGQAFREQSQLYLEIEVNGEILIPHIPIVASGWSMESDALDGKDSTAFAQLAVGNTFTAGGQTINTGSAATKGLIVKATAGQSANLQDWQDSTGMVIASVSSSGVLTGSHSGNGSGLTSLNAGNIASGVLPDPRLSGTYSSILNLTNASNAIFGNGSALTSLNASSLLSGTVPSGRLSGPYSGALSFTNAMNTFTGNGSALTTLNASNLSSGALPDARLSGLYSGAVTFQNASMDGFLFMNNNGPDMTQLIYFYDGGVSTGQFLDWSDPNARFEMSSGLKIGGNLVFEDAATTVRQIRNSYDIEIRKDTDANNTDAWFRIFTDAATEQMRIVDGDEAAALFDGAVTANGLDYAEAFGVLEPDLEAGEVVSLVPGAPDTCARSTRPADPNVLGVVSKRPAYVSGMSFDAEAQVDPALAAQRDAARMAGRGDEEKRLTLELGTKVRQASRPIALLGRLPVKVDGRYGPIRAGDRLTSSATAGAATAMTGAGPSIGIALESWDAPGAGAIMAFIQPGWVGAEAFSSAVTDSVSARGLGGASTDGPAAIDSPMRDRTGSAADLRTARAVESPAGAPSLAERVIVRDQGLAQIFVASEPVEAAEVVVADPMAPGSVQRGAKPADPAVLGIVVASPGVLMGGLSPAAAAGSSTATVAVGGVVPCRVDASYGAIHIGDLLAVSATPGHAMRSPDAAPGTIVGKALEPLESGAGVIRIVVMLR